MNFPPAMPGDDVVGRPVSASEVAEVCITGALSEIHRAGEVLAVDAETMPKHKLWTSTVSTYITVRDEVTRLANALQSVRTGGLKAKHFIVARVTGEMGRRLISNDLEKMAVDGKIFRDSDAPVVDFAIDLRDYMTCVHKVMLDRTKAKDRKRWERRFMSGA